MMPPASTSKGGPATPKSVWPFSRGRSQRDEKRDTCIQHSAFYIPPSRPRPNVTLSILLKNPSGQKVTVKKTISDVSPGNSNRVQTKLARKNSRHFSCIFTHLQKGGVLQQNQTH